LHGLQHSIWENIDAMPLLLPNCRAEKADAMGQEPTWTRDRLVGANSSKTVKKPELEPPTSESGSVTVLPLPESRSTSSPLTPLNATPLPCRRP
jgi:hypothetical protein